MEKVCGSRLTTEQKFQKVFSRIGAVGRDYLVELSRFGNTPRATELYDEGMKLALSYEALLHAIREDRHGRCKPGTATTPTD